MSKKFLTVARMRWLLKCCVGDVIYGSQLLGLPSFMFFFFDMREIVKLLVVLCSHCICDAGLVGFTFTSFCSHQLPLFSCLFPKGGKTLYLFSFFFPPCFSIGFCCSLLERFRLKKVEAHYCVVLIVTQPSTHLII